MTSQVQEISTEYCYRNTEADHTRPYLWEPVLKILQREDAKTVFDLGCGNGAFVKHLVEKGYDASGADPSSQGIKLAKAADPSLKVEQASAYDPLSERFGRFDAVVSLEVAPVVYYPRKFARCLVDLTKPGGIIAVSTAYHGYLKNLAVALMGRLDQHADPLWDHGIIKLWSIKTLTALFDEVGVKRESVQLLGRIPPLAKTMLMTFRKPK